MKNVADELGIAESTVSRAIRGKYMQTPKGVSEMTLFSLREAYQTLMLATAYPRRA